MLKLLQQVCAGAGVLALLVAGAAYLDSYLVAGHALARFEAARTALAVPALTVPAPEQSSWSAQARRRHYAAMTAVGGTPAPVAVLSIRRLGLKAPVFVGTDPLTLNRGIGLVDGTTPPGEAGNTVLAAHRDSFFRALRDIREGDRIDLETLHGHERYTVQKIFVTDPLDVSVLAPTAQPTLTLITCHPFYYVGFAPNRFIVRAVLQSTSHSLAISTP